MNDLMKKLRKTTISIGLAQPFQVLHLSDSHICRADERENQRKRDLAQRRTEAFDGGVPGQTEAYLAAQLAYADARQLPVLHTGDFCDFVSHKNLEALKDVLFSRDCFMAAGNHEYSLYVGEAFEDEAYKMQSYDQVQAVLAGHVHHDFETELPSGIRQYVTGGGYKGCAREITFE